MLGFLKGRLHWKSEEGNQFILCAGDVGYEVTVSPRVFDAHLEGEEISLWVHTHVREDVLTLFGFATAREKDFFRLLLSVSGLGPRHALALLAEHGTEHLTQLILSKNITGIAKAHGVGKKLAQRMTLDLPAKLEKLRWSQKASPVSAETVPVEQSPREQLEGDLNSALSNLGFSPQQVRQAMDRIFSDPTVSEMGFEECLRFALKELSFHNRTTSAEGVSRER